jgi:anti-sigma factor RsiW
MQDLLHAYIDDELDVAHTLDVERHLQGCPDCARACAELRELRAAFRSHVPRFTPPDGLRTRIRAALRPESEKGRRSLPRRWTPAGVAAAVILLAMGVLALAFPWIPPAEQDRLAQEVIASHVRSQLVDRHLLDIKSDDRHQVKPWFQGRLDFAPLVRDLRDDGFILEGGRLDYINGRPVAAVVYRRRQHVINVLTWPTPGEKDLAPRSETRQGYHLVTWRQQGMTWWAVSDLDSTELMQLAELLRDRD